MEPDDENADEKARMQAITDMVAAAPILDGDAVDGDDFEPFGGPGNGGSVEAFVRTSCTWGDEYSVGASKERGLVRDPDSDAGWKALFQECGKKNKSYLMTGLISYMLDHDAQTPATPEDIRSKAARKLRESDVDWESVRIKCSDLSGQRHLVVSEFIRNKLVSSEQRKAICTAWGCSELADGATRPPADLTVQTAEDLVEEAIANSGKDTVPRDCKFG